MNNTKITSSRDTHSFNVSNFLSILCSCLVVYMSIRPLADIIAQQLSGIFSGIDSDNIQSSLWEGKVELGDLSLNKARLNPKLGSIRILSSHVDRVRC